MPITRSVRACRDSTEHRTRTAKRMSLQATAVTLVDGIVAPMASQINPPQEAWLSRTVSGENSRQLKNDLS